MLSVLQSLESNARKQQRSRCTRCRHWHILGQLSQCCGVSADGNTCIVGTLDVALDHAASGEILKGEDSNAAYMVNVCVADVARRRGVGKELVAAAKSTAMRLGAQFRMVQRTC
jgi:ribosomal protein S18 acetylase RimI-like enzyme